MNPSNPDEQIKELLNLLRLEQAYEREQQRLLLEDTPLNQRVAKGITLYPLALRQQEAGLGGRVVLELGTSQSPAGFQPGQTVALFSLAAENEPPATGVVQRLGADWIKIYLNGDESPDWLDEGKLGLNLYYDETTWKAIHAAMERLQKAEDPRFKALRDILMGAATPHFLPGRPMVVDGLNDSQLEALNRVLAAEDLALIHGPPGTGKTTTLVACIEAVLQTEKQVLVSAPSNTAVDLLVQALGKRGRKVVRLGHPARMQEDIWPWTLEEQFADHPSGPVLQRLRREMVKLRRQAGKFKRNFGPAERAERRELYAQARALGREIRELEDQITATLLDRAEVIACTLVGSWQHVLKGRSFGTVFIDEAAQALEGAAWLPILKAKRLVMAGDHQQLPPTIKSPEASALSRTLFQKAIGHHPAAAVLLETQYRMHETIMEFPSLKFYEGRLKAAPSVAQHRLNEAEAPDAAINQPLEWLDTAGCGFDELLDPESQSYSNPEEGKLVILHLRHQLSDPALPEGPFSLGVIAPYRRQVEWLKTQVDQQLRPHLPARISLEVETVDSFQGQERDIVYYSFVRSNVDGEIGFLRDLRRTNVAMTRARKKLVLIGDSATLATHPFYRDLHEYVEAYGYWRSAWELAGEW